MITAESRVVTAARTTVIAVNAGRNSQYAVKWAVDHHLNKNSSCFLIHVRTKPITHSSESSVEDVPKHGRPPTQEELHQFFLPFRGFCARKGIEAKELVLHDIDVPSALIDYVVDNSIDNVVVGGHASPWSALMRRFKEADVATSLAKSLPETCTLHVVSRGKVQNIRPSGPPIPHREQSIAQLQDIEAMPTKSIRDVVTLLQNAQLIEVNKFIDHTLDSDSYDENSQSFKDGSKFLESLHDMKDVLLLTPHISNGVEDNYSPRDLILSAESISSQTSSKKSFPLSRNDSLGKRSNSDDLNCLFSPKPPLQISVEREIMKLKLELKKISEQYGIACKEAALAKMKATELEKLKEEKERSVEKSRLAEETALALAEVERQKAKAALESAEMSQCLAVMESQKRNLVELKAKHEEDDERKTLQDVVYNSIHCRRYNIKEIEVATNGFDTAAKIGEGGYGPVFKGMLDHTVVAIKVLRPDLAHGERQFQQEVLVLSTIRHPNMVLLLGACPEFGCLVYEHMENGSLEDRLFQKDNSPSIPWKTRFKIASQIATGLLFLHQTKPEPLVHRDLKPGNILLDKNYVSKISDVGLARLVPASVANKTTQYRMTGAAGTFFYIDPEYQQTGLLGVKSDIYSLGIVLLQIITAKPPMGLSHLVEEAIEKGNFIDVLDESMPDCPVEDALSFAKLALKCCELRKRDRPDLATVILPELNRISHIWNSDED